MNRLLRKYRRNGAVRIASTKLCQRSSPGSQPNLAISRSLLNALSSIQTNGVIIRIAPTVRTTYSRIRPVRNAVGRAAGPTVLSILKLVIGIRLLEQASDTDEERDHDHHDHGLGGRVAE